MLTVLFFLYKRNRLLQYNDGAKLRKIIEITKYLDSFFDCGLSF